MNNPVWLMSSAYPQDDMYALMDRAVELNLQGIEIVIPYDHAQQCFHKRPDELNSAEIEKIIDLFNEKSLKLSFSSYNNILGEPERMELYLDHLVNLIRLAALFGGNQNDIKVGTFVGYDRFLGREEEGFQKNLELYKRIFEPVINYASDHNVTILYENCPMEGLGGVKTQDTYNNLPCTLGARKLMYTLIPSDAHGETYDPSHDIWQFNNPLHVMKYFLWDKIHRIHIKSTRIKEDQASAEWGHVFRKQYVDPELAKRAQVKIAKSDMDRYNYRPTLPGFGDQGDFDWYRFFQELNKHHFNGPYVIENEAFNSMRTGNKKAVEQGICACRDFMAPNIWHLNGEEGYSYNKTTGSILNKEMKNIKAIKYKDLI